LLRVNNFGKVSMEDRLQIQTFRQQKHDAREIVTAYQAKGRNLSSVKESYRRVDKRSSATERSACFSSSLQLVTWC